MSVFLEPMYLRLVSMTNLFGLIFGFSPVYYVIVCVAEVKKSKGHSVLTAQITL